MWPDVRPGSTATLPRIATASGRSGGGQPAGASRTNAAAGPGGPPPAPRFGSAGRRLRIAALKLALPAIAACSLALVIALPTLWPGMERLRLRGSIPVANLAEGTDTMLDATFEGFDSRDRPFTIHSDIVRNVANEEEPMALASPRGKLTLKGGGEVKVTANSGLYDRQAERVDLNDDVTLVHPSGYEMSTSIAHIDLPTGDASGDEPVRAKGPLGTINAEGFRVTDDGRVINFTGRSRMTVDPKSQSTR